MIDNMDDYHVGARVLTPAGRAARIVKHLASESRLDERPRVVVLYDGGHPRRDQVTLQPHLLTVMVEES